jgi:hypothetical protein
LGASGNENYSSDYYPGHGRRLQIRDKNLRVLGYIESSGGAVEVEVGDRWLASVDKSDFPGQRPSR